jgi:hypothetical protein
MKALNLSDARGRVLILAAAVSAIAIVPACSKPDAEENAGAAQRVSAGAAGDYPAPRFLASLLTPTEDDLLSAARIAVRQSHGMSPLGKMEKGETVHVVLPFSQDMAVWEAIRKAWAERGVTALPIRPWEITGEDEPAYRARARKAVLHGDEAWKEIGVFDPAYYPLFSPAIQKEMGEPMRGRTLHKHLKGFLESRPDIKYFFSDAGGGANWIGVAIGPELLPRFVGNWTYLSALSLVNKSSAYPGDLWNMVEDKLIAPLEHVSEGSFTDPEGTDLKWVINADQARKWKQYVALVNNHMFMYPQPTETLKFSGTVRGASNHTGFFPTMKVHLSDRGRVTKVEGGGKTGDLFRILLDHPKLKNVRFPSTPETGYWYLAADGFATNPKKVRDMQTLIAGSAELPNMSERERAGVMHLSFSSGAGNYEMKLSDVQAAIKAGKTHLGPKNADVRDLMHALKNDIPMGHTAHIHNYFGTLKWRLRDTGEWITQSDKGRITTFDDPEVRALASRYGDPETLFSYDWIPAIPGINVPGNYDRDYGADPWKWVVDEYNRIKTGKYSGLLQDYEVLKGSVSSDNAAARKK